MKPSSVALFVHSVFSPGLSRRNKNLWKLSPLIDFGFIWKERNRRLFEYREENITNLRSSILASLFYRVKVLDSCIGLIFENFLYSFVLELLILYFWYTTLVILCFYFIKVYY